MKGFDLISKMEKYFDFSKWTKKMSEFHLAEYSLLTDFFITIPKIYRHKLNEEKYFVTINFFIYMYFIYYVILYFKINI